MNAPATIDAKREAMRHEHADAILKAKLRADHDDTHEFGEASDTPVMVQVYATVEWDDSEWICGSTRREAFVDVIGARIGGLFLTRDMLDSAFPGEVGRLEASLSEKYTAWGEK